MRTYAQPAAGRQSKTPKSFFSLHTVKTLIPTEQFIPHGAAVLQLVGSDE
jgi:hypothetical protein